MAATLRRAAVSPAVRELLDFINRPLTGPMFHRYDRHGGVLVDQRPEQEYWRRRVRRLAELSPDALRFYADLDPGTLLHRHEQPEHPKWANRWREQALVELLERQDAERRQLRARGVICPWVFHRNGKPIRTFYTAWRRAATKAGVPGRIVHDFRRTAVRTFVRAGVAERVAMQLSGHLTRSVFDRYNIVSEADLQDAARKLDARATGTVTGTAGQSDGGINGALGVRK